MKTDGRKLIWQDPAHRAKMRLAHLGQKAWNKGKTKETDTRLDCDRPTKFKRGQNSLEKHPMWKGGISKIDKKVRCMPEYILWRTQVFERDQWTCQTCRSRGYVTAHHIKSFVSILRENNIQTIEDARQCDELWNVDNGVALCEHCHSLTDNYKGRCKVKNGANSAKLPTETSGQHRAKSDANL